MELTQFKTVEKLAAAIKTLDMVTSVPWTDYSGTSAITGWSSTTTKEIWYKKIGKLVFVQYRIEGTSNSTAISVPLPYDNNSHIRALFKPARAMNNSSWLNGSACGRILASGSNTALFYTDESLAAWTASGTKVIMGEFWYVAA